MKSIGIALLFLVVFYPIIVFTCCIEKKPPIVAYVPPLPELNDELAGHFFVPDASRLALYWENGNFEIWDTESGKRIQEKESLPRTIAWCSASPKSTTLLTGDRLPSIIHPADPDLLKERFHPTLRIWDLKSGKLKHSMQIMEIKVTSFGHNDWYSLWLDDTHALIVWLWRYNSGRAAEELQLILIDTAKGKIAKVSRIFKWAGEHLTLSPNRKLAVTRDDNSVNRYRNTDSKTHIIDLEHFTLVTSWKEPRDPNAPQWEVNGMITRWSPDSNYVLTIGDERKGAKARIQDAKTGTILQTFAGHTSWIWDADFTSKGDKLLTASEDGSVRVWDVKTGQTILEMKDHHQGVKKVLVLPGDSLVVSSADDQIAKIWDIETGKVIRELSDHPSAIRQMELISNQVLQTVTEQGTKTDWDWSTGRKLNAISEIEFGICRLVDKKGRIEFRRPE